jgi:hypothetical protein
MRRRLATLDEVLPEGFTPQRATTPPARDRFSAASLFLDEEKFQAACLVGENSRSKSGLQALFYSEEKRPVECLVGLGLAAWTWWPT